jgi:FkbM family methyltransferase
MGAKRSVTKASSLGFCQIIESALKSVPGNQELAQIFLCEHNEIVRFVIGKNEESTALINLVNINGVIDDYALVQTYWNGIPIIQSSELPINAVIVNCSTSISPVLVTDKLSSCGFKNILSFHEILYASNGKLSSPKFVKEMNDDYQKHRSDWLKIFDLLADDESRKTLLDIVRYRLTADSNYMRNYEVRLKDQYFEDFLQIKNEVFVDAGGYDGDTTLEFCKRYPDYKRILFFEPSPLNMSLAKRQTDNIRDIIYYHNGLSDIVGTLFFDPYAGSSSSVKTSGNQKDTISVTTLDLKVEEPVSFIKMDIEGWELKALVGCRQHIICDRPKLAIAVYHNAKDFYKIPSYILSLNPYYNLYLRHYTQGWSETIMYFVPNNQ